ncbi:hypothetical protein BA763_11785 [Burkholderia cenocepacia]|nr:hypothetical protein BA763_11785 [Burkholderia cenocepacia]
MLDYAPNARKIAVGKRCGQRSTAQHFINKQIVDAAREHACVVRLKGGDPMLFGRAEEEMRALEAAGIDYEVVPGITAAHPELEHSVAGMAKHAGMSPRHFARLFRAEVGMTPAAWSRRPASRPPVGYSRTATTRRSRSPRNAASQTSIR